MQSLTQAQRGDDEEDEEPPAAVSWGFSDYGPKTRALVTQLLVSCRGGGEELRLRMHFSSSSRVYSGCPSVDSNSLSFVAACSS